MRQFQTMKRIRVTFSILMSPRCHRVPKILKTVSPILLPQTERGDVVRIVVFAYRRSGGTQ
jgi:hypothetical protein